jgi:cell division septation protein DedD
VDDVRKDTQVRELRIEGRGLLLAGLVLGAALVGAFFFGRWVERFGRAEASPGGNQGAAGGPAREPEAAPEEVTFFDTLSGGGKEAEPRREASSRPPAPAVPAPPVASSGVFSVQVFAGRDRTTAEEVAKTLMAKGYPVRMTSEAEGKSALYKVRVGRYATKGEAQAAAERLRREGQSGAWVTKN